MNLAAAGTLAAVAPWHGRDLILKERLGLTGNQDNHGEGVKECYFYPQPARRVAIPKPERERCALWFVRNVLGMGRRSINSSRQPAIDGDRCAGDIAGTLRRQKDYQVGELVRLSQPA